MGLFRQQSTQSKDGVCVCVSQSHLTLCDPMDYSLPGFSVYAVFQARILEQVTISYSRGSSLPRDQTCISCVSCMSRQIHYNCHLRSAHTTPDLTKRLRMSQEYLYPALLIQQNLCVWLRRCI